MADRGSAAPQSRRTISRSPQSPRFANQPRRSQRVTRSQSRDISDSEVERKVKNQSKIKQPGASVDWSAIPGRQRNGRSKQNDAAGGLQVQPNPHTNYPALVALPELEESTPIKYPELPDSANDGSTKSNTAPGIGRRPNAQLAKSPGGTSNFSGTTARISGSGHDFSVISAEDMTDALPELCVASNKILDLLMPENISESSVQIIKDQHSDMKSKQTRQLRRLVPNFQAQREVYGGDRFIDVPAAVRAIIGVSRVNDVRLGPWRVDPVLYQANLASLITALVAQSGEDKEQLIDGLDKAFPQPFVHRFIKDTPVTEVADGSALLKQTFELALEIRSLFFINSARRLLNESGFDPDELLTQVFYTEQDRLKGWNVAGLGSDHVHRNVGFRASIINRLDQLRATFSEEVSPVDLEELDKAFPYARLSMLLVQWSQLRLREIKTQLHDVDGVAGLIRAIQTANRGYEPSQDTLNNHMPNDNEVVLEDERPTPLGFEQLRITAPKSPRFSSSEAQQQAMARFKARQGGKRISVALVESGKKPAWTPPTTEISASTPSPTQQGVAVPSDIPPSYQPPPDMYDDNELFIPSGVDESTAKQILRTHRNLEAESNKENLPARPPLSQPQEENLSSQGHRRNKGPRGEVLELGSNARKDNSTQKITASVVDRTQADQSDSDGDFQEDSRQMAPPQRSNPSSRQNRHGSTGPGPAAKRRREAQGNRDVAGYIDLNDIVEQHNNANGPPPSQAEMSQIINKRAKMKTASLRRKVQVRTPWSEEETDRLLDLIADHGISWSYLKTMDEDHAQGSLFRNRDQVALKDKARNMKADYLKSGVPLPLNFDLIPLSNALVQKLAAVGIRYDPATGDRANGTMLDDASNSDE
ncbi:MAG: hypothetical protein Q9177_003720 [Variospora cf. flavescens]